MGEGYKLIRVEAIKHTPPQVGLILTLSKLVRYAKSKNLKDILFIEDDLILNFTIGYYIVNSDPTASATTRIFDELAPKFFQNDYKDDDPPKDVAPSDSVVLNSL